jgi:hypothetical protein
MWLKLSPQRTQRSGGAAAISMRRVAGVLEALVSAVRRSFDHIISGLAGGD